MNYEWDEAKRLLNLTKHGIDFLDADLVFEAIPKVTVNVTRSNNKEIRFADFAEVNGCVLKLVYALRGKFVRCISLRVASQKERRALHKWSFNRHCEPFARCHPERKRRISFLGLEGRLRKAISP